MPQAQFQAQQMPVLAATMEAFLAGMTGVQTALQQLMEHQRQQAASSSQPGGSGFDPDHIPLFQYTRLNEVVFDGVSGDPMDFLDEVEKRAFDLRASDRRTIEMAGFSLKGLALQWYKDYIKPFLEGMTWAQFRARFEDNYISFAMRQEYWRQFEQLKRDDMSVVEYTRRFMYLSKFAPELVAVEAAKTSKYITGLGPHFISLVQSRKCSFLEVTDMARQMETDLRLHGILVDEVKKETRTEEQTSTLPAAQYYGGTGYFGGTAQQSEQFRPRGHKKGRRNQKGYRGFRIGQGFRPSGGYSSRGQSSGSGYSSASSGTSMCPQCGWMHQGPCMAASGACFRCGELGHMAKIMS